MEQYDFVADWLDLCEWLRPRDETATVSFSWTCRNCGEENNWTWDREDLVEGPVELRCQHCDKNNKCYLMVNDDVVSVSVAGN